MAEAEQLKIPFASPAGVEDFVFHYAAFPSPSCPDGSLGLPRHVHDELELNQVIAGEAVCLMGDLRVQLRRQDQLWLWPGHNHALVEDSPDFEMWVGAFKPRLLDRTCSSEATSLLRDRQGPGMLHGTLGLAQMRRLRALIAVGVPSAQVQATLEFGAQPVWPAQPPLPMETPLDVLPSAASAWQPADTTVTATHSGHTIAHTGCFSIRSSVACAWSHHAPPP